MVRENRPSNDRDEEEKGRESASPGRKNLESVPLLSRLMRAAIIDIP